MDSRFKIKDLSKNMENIIQKKSGTEVAISFEEMGLNYSLKDKKSSDKFFVNFEEIPNDTNFTTESNSWFLNAGILWCVIGSIQLFYIVRSGKFILPFWFLLGAGCILWYLYKKIKYTYIKTGVGNILIIRDKNHDEILNKIHEKKKRISQEKI